jgi:serine protease
MGFVRCAFAAVVALFASAAVANAPMSPDEIIPGRALLKLAHDVTVDGAASQRATNGPFGAFVDVKALQAIEGRTGIQLQVVKRSILGWLVVDIATPALSKPTERQTRDLIAALARDEGVAAASENRWARAFATPSDPNLNQMWNITSANLLTAWDDEQGNATQRIGVVDTGLIRTHEDVGAKAVAGFDFISSASTAGDGNGRDADFQDVGDACNGSNNSFHGTHVAGTIAAFTDNGVGIAGVNWNARLSVVRALGRCGGDIVDIMEGSLWLAGGQIAGVPNIGADRVSVMNLSLGSRGSCTAFEQDAINAIDAAGVVFVAAAGNDGGAVNSPANCNNVISVAAHGPSRARAPYSSFGTQIDIVAPGGDLQGFGAAGGILSTLGPTTNAYSFYEGTSMAAPHVTGVVSLMQAKDPSVDRTKAETALIAGGVGCTNCSGKVALDAAGALAQLVRGGTPVEPPPPLVDDDLEENDVAADAVELQCGANLNLVALERDQDWFFVDVDPGPLSLNINGGTNDLDLYILRNNTEILVRSEGATGVEAINADVTRTQRLQILVNPFADGDSAASGAYTLTLSCTGATSPIEPDPTDPDPGVDPDPGIEPEPTDPVTPPGPGDGDDDEEEPGDGDDVPAGPAASGGPPGAAGGCAQGGSAFAWPAVFAAALVFVRRRRRR